MSQNKVMILLEKHEQIAPEAIKMLEKKDYDLFFPSDIDNVLDDPSTKDCDAILVRGATVDESFFDRMPNLKIVARCGVGTDNIAITKASNRNIYVCNVPSGNCVSVAEHVLGLMISLSRHTIKTNKALKEGNYEARSVYEGVELSGKTIGIIGLGQIGQLIAKKCIYGLNMNVLAYDPYVHQSYEQVTIVDSVDSIFDKADYITLHLPYKPALHHFVDERLLKKMKKNAYIINCARGGLIDDTALAKAVKSGDIAGAGVDVFEQEPPSKDYVLLGIENIIVTPHTAASTKESLSRMSVGSARNIIQFLNGKEPENAVNKHLISYYM